ncbi:MAG TPA: DNA polymerase ligase N-terminal domain-containing protein [Candidatus Dormibacteraeota bacterium]|nr:DNA polymerase ligase N-terminal domain-containing protein [Candidatus Dormibacteraeota bacterium]
MSLTVYGRKRRFDRTPEPPPQRRPRARRGALRFVVQKHRARRLHYDFRLEWDGVLLSWAVPKGPSLKPRDKRLAVEVEDHPLDYAGFEGIIPADNYGAGTVMVWDRGTYTPAEPDVGKSRQRGRIDFTLHGKKLRGAWVLVRSGSDRRNWLMIKRHDEGVSETDVTATAPRSVKSRRLMVEIAFDEGGDVEQAVSADPTAEVQALLRDRRTRRRRPRATPSVWKSNR